MDLSLRFPVQHRFSSTLSNFKTHRFVKVQCLCVCLPGAHLGMSYSFSVFRTSCPILFECSGHHVLFFCYLQDIMSYWGSKKCASLRAWAFRAYQLWWPSISTKVKLAARCVWKSISLPKIWQFLRHNTCYNTETVHTSTSHHVVQYIAVQMTFTWSQGQKWIKSEKINTTELQICEPFFYWPGVHVFVLWE